MHREAKPPATEPWRRLSGIHTLRAPRNLAVARALWLARDAVRLASSTSPRAACPGSSILAVAKALPESKRALADLKEFTGRASRTELDRWWAAIERGPPPTELPADRVPSDSPRRRAPGRCATPRPTRGCGSRGPGVTEVAEQLDMPAENLLTPEHLRRVAWHPPAEPTAAIRRSRTRRARRPAVAG